MNPDTPLTEVAHHLSPQAADYLGNQAQSVQMAVLKMVRHTITVFEQSGVALDPMSYQVVVDQYVGALVGAFNSSAAIAHQLEQLRQIAASNLPGPQMLHQLQEVLNGR